MQTVVREQLLHAHAITNMAGCADYDTMLKGRCWRQKKAMMLEASPT
jgi:hypothetical protein